MKTPTKRTKCTCQDATCAVCVRRQVKSGRELKALTEATRAKVSEASPFNRFRIWDGVDARYMHIGYDTFASAERASLKMNKGLPANRYHVVSTSEATR